MTIASPSRFVVADIKWLLREFQRFPSSVSKKFRGRIDPRSLRSAQDDTCSVSGPASFPEENLGNIRSQELSVERDDPAPARTDASGARNDARPQGRR